VQKHSPADDGCPSFPSPSSYRHEESEAVRQEYLDTMQLFQKTTENVKKERKALMQVLSLQDIL